MKRPAPSTRRARTPPSPSRGVPVTVKDAIVTKGTRSHSRFQNPRRLQSVYDAFVVERLKAAGRSSCGKNNMDEFAMGSSTEKLRLRPDPQPPRSRTHPRRLQRRLGRQRRREPVLRLPRHGHRRLHPPARSPVRLRGPQPTYGRVSRYGVIAYGSSLDQVGPLTRTVEDAALVLSVIAGHDKRDSTSSPRPVDGYADFFPFRP